MTDNYRIDILKIKEVEELIITNGFSEELFEEFKKENGIDVSALQAES